MKIKKYLEYITELRRITSDQSGSGRTRFVDKIYDDPSSDKSLSAGVLLRKKLKDEEFQDVKNQLLPSMPDHFIKNYINKHSNPSKIRQLDKLRITMNNLQFLKDKAKEGDLYCEYCNAGPLVIYDINPDEIYNRNKKYRINTKFNPSDGATADHKDPLSKGGEKFDYNNLAVCCSKCNKKKGNMNFDTWMHIIGKEV